MASGKSLEEIEGYKIILLFLAFLLVTYIFEKLSETADHYLVQKQRFGLSHTFQQLKQEVLTLGLVSLILAASEDTIFKICVKSKSSDSQYDSKKDSEQQGSAKSLLAVEESSCGDGKEPMWSRAALHDTHLLIFLIAICNIIYPCLSMLICGLRVRRWKKYEQQSSHEMIPVSDDVQPGHQTLKKVFAKLPKLGSNRLSHQLYSITGQFSGVKKSTYFAMRRLFLERMGVGDELDFYAFMVESFEEHYAYIVRTEWFTWVLAILVVWLRPYSVPFPLILSALMLFMQLFMGAQLSSILRQMSFMAYEEYRDQPCLPTATKATLMKSLKQIKPNLMRLSNRMGRHGDKGASQGISNQAAHGGIVIHQQNDPSQDERIQSVFLDTQGKAPTSDAQHRKGGSVAMVDKNETANPAQGLLPDQVGGVTQSDPQNIAAPLDRANQQTQYRGTFKKPQSTLAIKVTKPREECSGEGSSSHQAQVSALDVTQTHSSGQGGFFKCFACGHCSHSSKREQGNRIPVPKLQNSAQLFWWGRPELFLRLLQVAYFEGSLTIAALLFNQWRSQDIIRVHYSDTFYIAGLPWDEWILLVFSLLSMLHGALNVMPMYVLTATSGSHCVQSLVQHALERGEHPDVALVVAQQQQLLEQYQQGNGESSMDGSGPPTVSSLVSPDNEGEALQRASSENVKNEDDSIISPANGPNQQSWRAQHALGQKAHGHGVQVNAKQKLLDSILNAQAAQLQRKGIVSPYYSPRSQLRSPLEAGRPNLQRRSVPVSRPRAPQWADDDASQPASPAAGASDAQQTNLESGGASMRKSVGKVGPPRLQKMSWDPSMSQKRGSWSGGECAQQESTFDGLQSSAEQGRAPWWKSLKLPKQTSGVQKLKQGGDQGVELTLPGPPVASRAPTESGELSKIREHEQHV